MWLLLHHLTLTAAFMGAPASAAIDPSTTALVKLPLRLFQQRTYVTDIVVNGDSVAMEVSTLTSTVSLSCARLALIASPLAIGCTSSSSNTLPSCSTTISRRATPLCATHTNATLSIPASGLHFREFPIAVVHDQRNYTEPQAPTSMGELGLGFHSALLSPELLDSQRIHNFSVFLTDSPDGNGSFLQLGGSLRTQLQDHDNSNAITLPVLPATNANASGWDLSLSAVRLGTPNTPLLYPRVYGANEMAGGDAIATLSLSHSTIEMPPAMFSYFQRQYLAATRNCEPSGGAGDQRYVCDESIVTILPRIALYISDRAFYLTPDDYTRRDMSVNGSRVRVLLSASTDESLWLLGSPFLRKFPTLFNRRAQSIDLLCQLNVTCDVVTPGMTTSDREQLPSNYYNSTDNSRGVTTEDEAGMVSKTLAPTIPSTGSAVVFWMGFFFGLLGLFFATINAVVQWRQRHNALFQGNGTVASDKDLEELQGALRQMGGDGSSSSAIEAGGGGGTSGFVSLQSPRTAR